MSRPETHPADFDHLPFDPALPHGVPHPPYAPPRDVPREFWSPRDQQPRDPPHDLHGPTRTDPAQSSFYHTPSASMPSLSLASLAGAGPGEGPRPPNGLAGIGLAPRMFGLGSPGVDGWSPGVASMNGGMPMNNGGGPQMNNGGMVGGSSGPSPSRPAVPSVAQAIMSPTSGMQSSGMQPPVQQQQNLVLNHHHRASPPRPPLFSPTSPPATSFSDRETQAIRDAYFARQFQQAASPPLSVSSPQPASLPSPNAATPPRSTLWWGELEPWMDEEYAKQVCNLMGWDPLNIKVPRPAPDPVTGRQANNPGYCFLTFPSQAHAAAVLAQINPPNGSGPMTMPNSSKSFTMNWASSVPTAPLSAPFSGPTISIPGAQNPQYPKEYSIFVGDLAPEVSNSDLVAVFRNPVLGLRNDREPRFIRPFLSCKSAKIMLDPVTGVSRGYGFVRFTDEADQQRALIEMHGLYCLSRPMRISPATAKFKPVPGMPGLDFQQLSQMQFPPVMPALSQPQPQLPQQPQPQPQLAMPPKGVSVSAPLATALGSNTSIGSSAGLSSASGSASSLSATSSLSTNPTSNSSSTLASVPSEELLKSVVNSVNNGPATPGGNASSISSGLAQQTQDQLMAQRYNIPEESWKHHAQARAILSNLIGPNGEQLTSSDPYNTTVFVGGLSPLISEETLRTFFAPFGEIHYVKVPVGKHCGFVQFVRKPDAERAIEKMQGFPIGGSRIRLSWGRSQYKAAQAAAQAAQAAALQAQYQVQLPSPDPLPLTAEQAMQLLEKFGIAQFLNNGAVNPNASGNINVEALQSAANAEHLDMLAQHDGFVPSATFSQVNHGPAVFNAVTSFSPFSPDPNFMPEGMKRDNVSPTQGQPSSYPIKGYAPWYNPQQDEKLAQNPSGKVSPQSSQTSRPASARAFSNFLGDAQNVPPFQASRASSRQEAPIARPEMPRRPSQTLQSQEATLMMAQDREHDFIQDLNGTLASLNLNDNQGSWKVNVEGAHPTSP